MLGVSRRSVSERRGRGKSCLSTTWFCCGTAPGLWGAVLTWPLGVTAPTQACMSFGPQSPPYTVQLLSSSSGPHKSAPPEFLRQNLGTHEAWIHLVKLWQSFLSSAPAPASLGSRSVVPPPVHASLSSASWGSPLSQSALDPRFFQDPRFLSYINPYRPPQPPLDAPASPVDAAAAQVQAQVAAQAQAQAQAAVAAPAAAVQAAAQSAHLFRLC